MKTYLTYGAAMAGGGFVIVLILYLLGLHSDPAKISTAGWIQMAGGCVVSIGCIVLGTKARLAATPVTEEFGYGSALGAGVMITLFAAIIGIATNLLYTQVINPGYMDVSGQAQVAKWEAAGMSSAQIEQAQTMMKKMTSPALQAIFGLVFAMIFGTLISLITSIFLRRPAVDEPPTIG